VARRDNQFLHLYPKVDTGTGQRWVLADQGKAALNDICGALNSKTDSQLKWLLRLWVSTWQATGPNLKKMMEGLRGVPELSESYLWALSFAMRTVWGPTDGARAQLFLVPDYLALENQLGETRVWQEDPDGKRKPTPEAKALTLFHLLTVIPGCEKLAGPCPRCDRYYIKKRASQTVYCSRRCGNAATAVVRTRERIADERADKLTRATAAMKKWKPAATRQDWKRWVAQKTGIDLRFLTRAVTKGDLVPPHGKR